MKDNPHEELLAKRRDNPQLTEQERTDPWAVDEDLRPRRRRRNDAVDRTHLRTRPPELPS